jgi:hypothetical protein
MRVGAAGETVLGTIHGEDPDAVRERVVSDLGVSASSFAATDLIVLLDDHRVDEIAEVTARGDGSTFDPLFKRTSDGLTPTGRIDRGESRLVERLARTDESYAAVREAVEARGERIHEAVVTGQTEPRQYAEFVRRGGEIE